MKTKSLAEILQLPAAQAAPLLLSCILSRRIPGEELALKIVETEAYHQDDPASHSFRGQTTRTAPMFQSGGTIYVYFTYGMHYCVNIVVGPKGRGEAVLLRAGEPLRGIEVMKKHRHTQDVHNIASGPAKFTQALGVISTELSGKRLSPKTLQLELPPDPLKPKDIGVSRRIGISQAQNEPLRFYVKNSLYLSRRSS